jgi:hypothetical protein
MMSSRTIRAIGRCLAASFVLCLAATSAFAGPAEWRREFPATDFSRRTADPGEVSDAGLRDSIPAIDSPRFVSRAYPLRILLWHEIINDDVGGTPVAITFAPLSGSFAAFDRRVDGMALLLGNTGRLRHHDTLLYDHETGSWWQQLTGEAVFGRHAGTALSRLPARLESLGSFLERAPEGEILLPPDPPQRPYGETPYAGVDDPITRLQTRFPYRMPDGVLGLDRVVAVGKRAWQLSVLRHAGRIEVDDLVLAWSPGQNSVHDRRVITEGADVGNVTVRRRSGDGLVDATHTTAFAFAFIALVPDGTINPR